MPAFSHLTAEQLRQLASLVVSLQRPESESVRIEDAWVAETSPETDVTSAYMTLVTTRRSRMSSSRSRPRVRARECMLRALRTA